MTREYCVRLSIGGKGLDLFVTNAGEAVDIADRILDAADNYGENPDYAITITSAERRKTE